MSFCSESLSQWVTGLVLQVILSLVVCMFVSVFVDVYYSLQSGWVSFRVFSVVCVSVGLLCTTYAVFCVVTLRVCGLRPSSYTAGPQCGCRRSSGLIRTW